MWGGILPTPEGAGKQIRHPWVSSFRSSRFRPTRTSGLRGDSRGHRFTDVVVVATDRRDWPAGGSKRESS